MIYEMRTYDLKPTTVPEVLRRFGEAYPYRKQYSELAAVWYTDIGPLNQIVHIWPYRDLEERARVREAAVQDPHWPPQILEFILRMETEIYVPFPFSPELKPGTFGPYYEMRSYFVKPQGGLASTQQRWEPMLEERMRLSPLSVVMRTELGPLNKYVHIWPYESLNQRAEIRKRAVETGVWPPPGGAETLVSQENKILLPASFSPMQ